MYIALATHRARTRVERRLARGALPWLCGWRGSHGPKAGCTEVTDDEWPLVAQIPSVKRCTVCALAAARRNQLPLPI